MSCSCSFVHGWLLCTEHFFYTDTFFTNTDVHGGTRKLFFCTNHTNLTNVFLRTRIDTEVSRKVSGFVHCVRILSEQYFSCTNLTNLTNVMYGTYGTHGRLFLHGKFFERTRTYTEVHGNQYATFVAFGYYPNNIFPVRISRISLISEISGITLVRRLSRMVSPSFPWREGVRIW